MQHIDPLRIRLYTTADIARPGFPPRLEIWNPTIPIPWQTGLLGGVASTLSSFFGAGHGAAEIEGIRESSSFALPLSPRQLADLSLTFLQSEVPIVLRRRSGSAQPPPPLPLSPTLRPRLLVPQLLALDLVRKPFKPTPTRL